MMMKMQIIAPYIYSPGKDKTTPQNPKKNREERIMHNFEDKRNHEKRDI